MRHATTTQLPTAGAVSRRDLRFTTLRMLGAALFGATLLAIAAASAHADSLQRYRDWDDGYRILDTWADGRLVDVQLRVDGDAAALYAAPNGDDRHYFQAFAGRNYSVVMKNNTGRRVAVLLAVDGLNAVNGEITQLRPSEDMYVLGPWEQATIRGWRTSLDEVRRFVFVDEQKSYAERSNQANSDMGWIRVLAFNERLPWWQTRRDRYGSNRQQFRGEPGPQSSAPVPEENAPRAQSENSKDAAPSPDGAMKSMAPEAQDNLSRGEADQRGGAFPGTGWGQRQQDRVNRTQFTPDPVAVDQLIFRYEYASGLQALGILPVRRFRDRLHERDGEMGFAKPPRW